MDNQEIKCLEKKPKSPEEYTKIAKSEQYDYLEFDWINDFLVTEIYAKERGLRVQVFGVQLDEMWSFVQNKDNKQWIWLALNPLNRQIVAFHSGGRGKKRHKFFMLLYQLFLSKRLLFLRIIGVLRPPSFQKKNILLLTKTAA